MDTAKYQLKNALARKKCADREFTRNLYTINGTVNLEIDDESTYGPVSQIFHFTDELNGLANETCDVRRNDGVKVRVRVERRPFLERVRFDQTGTVNGLL